MTGLEDFPADLDSSVCPTSAITWETANPSPTVNPETCISCGLCVSRCPVGAIGMREDSIAFINDEDNEYFQQASKLRTPKIVDEIKSKFSGMQTSGRFLLETDALLGGIYNRIAKLMKTTPKLPQHLTRNLLLALGNQAAMRRLGDVNVRMELVFANPVSVGTAEVEIGEGVLDAPRNILDNIAVLVSRYHFSKTDIASLIVSLQLPRQRTDYWLVLKDIKGVLDVRIGTLTIGALMILVWEQKYVHFHVDNQFYADDGNRSIRKALESILGRDLNVSPRLLGIAEPAK